MHARKTNRLILIAGAVLAVAISSPAQESRIGKWDGHPDAGKQLFFRYCWGCHGFRGDGNGENGPYLNVPASGFGASPADGQSEPAVTLPTVGRHTWKSHHAG